jgi:hypothetical protein
MAEAAGSGEDVAHDDLCPVCASETTQTRGLILAGLPIAFVHSCKDAV